jgi:hypothetical protein
LKQVVLKFTEIGDETCGKRDISMMPGAIPADRSAPTWRAAVVALLDKRGAEH